MIIIQMTLMIASKRETMPRKCGANLSKVIQVNALTINIQLVLKGRMKRVVTDFKLFGIYVVGMVLLVIRLT